MRLYMVFFLLLSIASVLYSQKYERAFNQVFDFQQPDAVSEAMGKVQVVQTGSPVSAIYNPASSSFSKGLSIHYTYLEPYSIVFGTDPKKNSFSISYNTHKYGAISFTTQYFSNGTFHTTQRDTASPKGYSDYQYTPTASRYCFNYSYSIPEYFSIGLNANCLEEKSIGGKSQTAWFFDFGLMKNIVFENAKYKQNILAGASISNFTNKKVDNLLMIYIIENGLASHTFANTDVKTYLPTYYRFGASYEFETKLELAGYRIFKAKAAAEYSFVGKLDYYQTIKTGAELTFMEMLRLRIGYYNEKIGDENSDIWYKDYLSQFTYGVGLNLPIHKLLHTQLPVNLQFDFSANKALSEYKTNPEDKICYIYNFGLNIGI